MEGTGPGVSRIGGAYLAGLILVGALMILPVLTVPFPPLVDLPNHLAESHILSRYSHSAIFRANYETTLAPFPNLGATLLLFGLMRLLPPLVAAKALLVLLMALWLLGGHLIAQAVTGRTSWYALPVAMAGYNSSLYYGFMNYSIGLPLFLITFAVWLRWRSALRWYRLLILIVLVMLCYLSHLSAYLFAGAGAVAWQGIEVLTARRRRWRDLLPLVPLLPPVLFFLSYMGGDGEVGGVEWGYLIDKSVAFLSPLIGYDRRADVVVLALAGAAALVALIGGRPTWRPGALACSLVFALAVFATPQFIFTSSGADIRFAVPALILLLLAADIRPAARRAGRAALALLMIALTVKILAVWQAWDVQSREIACTVQTMEGVEAGARIVPIYLRSPDRAADKRQRGLIHVAHYATIKREAFVPSLFSYTSQQMVRIRDASPAPEAVLHEDVDPATLDWAAIRADFDYIWICRPTPGFQAPLAAIARPVARCRDCELWKVLREAP